MKNASFLKVKYEFWQKCNSFGMFAKEIIEPRRSNNKSTIISEIKSGLENQAWSLRDVIWNIYIYHLLTCQNEDEAKIIGVSKEIGEYNFEKILVIIENLADIDGQLKAKLLANIKENEKFLKTLASDTIIEQEKKLLSKENEMLRSLQRENKNPEKQKNPILEQERQEAQTPEQLTSRKNISADEKLQQGEQEQLSMQILTSENERFKRIIEELKREKEKLQEEKRDLEGENQKLRSSQSNKETIKEEKTKPQNKNWTEKILKGLIIIASIGILIILAKFLPRWIASLNLSNNKSENLFNVSENIVPPAPESVQTSLKSISDYLSMNS